MKKSIMLLAPGFEEMEATNPLDILRRGGVDVQTVAITESPLVAGAHGIGILADTTLDDADLSDLDFIILPGGIPGAPNLAGDSRVAALLKDHAAAGGRIAAICASPAVVLYPLGILDGLSFTGYPGTEGGTDRARFTADGVTAHGNIITAKGPAFAIDFGLAILKAIKGEDAAAQVAADTLYNELMK